MILKALYKKKKNICGQGALKVGTYIPVRVAAIAHDGVKRVNDCSQRTLTAAV